MSTFDDKYAKIYSDDDFNKTTGMRLVRDIIFTQVNPDLDTPENVHIGIKCMPEQLYDQLRK